MMSLQELLRGFTGLFRIIIKKINKIITMKHIVL